MLLAMDARDVERIRLPAEGVTAAVGSRAPSATPDSASAIRARLRARSLPLTRAIAPRVYAALERARTRLSIAHDVEIFQSPAGSLDQWNAQHLGQADGVIFLQLHGVALELLDDASLTTVMGHELGHHLAHAGRQFAADGFDMKSRLAVELTADRFGLLAEPDLAATMRLQVANAGGVRADIAGIDVDAYQRWCVTEIEDGLANGGSTFGVSHPEHTVRAYASVLFAESDLFRELTGHGPATRDVEAVNQVLDRLLTSTPIPHWVAQVEPQRSGESGATPPSPPKFEAVSHNEALPSDLLVKIDPLERALLATKDAAVQVRHAALDAASWWVGRPRPPRVEYQPLPEPEVEEAEVDPIKADLLARFAELEKKLAKKT